MPPDIHPLFKHTPPQTHPYLKLMRLDRPTGTWLLLLPCWWGLVLAHGGIFNMGAKGWSHALLFALGAVLMRGAGCVVNDLWDRDLDAQVARTKTRPLAAGDVTPKQALAFLGILLLLSLAILLAFGSTFATILGASSLMLVATYPLMKRVTWWPQLFLGFTFNWGALMGFAVTQNTLGIEALLLYAGGILWTLGYDTIYAHQDMEDDAVAGIRSTARLFGDRSKQYVTGFFIGALILFTAAKFIGAPSFMTPLFLLPPTFVAFHMLKHWNPSDPASSLKVFNLNKRFGIFVLLMLSL